MECAQSWTDLAHNSALNTVTITQEDEEDSAAVLSAYSKVLGSAAKRQESTNLSAEDTSLDQKNDTKSSSEVPELVDEDDRRASIHQETASSTILRSDLYSKTSAQRLATQSSPKSIKPVLKSNLRSALRGQHNGSSSLLHRHNRPSTARRVRGLWNDSTSPDCHLKKLRDETIAHVLSYLNLGNLLSMGMVSQRYKSIVHNQAHDATIWNTVDATEFVKVAHANFLQRAGAITTCCGEQVDETTKRRRREYALAQKQTGQALEEHLKKHKPSTLIIRDIHDRLSADSFLPGVGSLKKLALTHFQDLSDTHVHVLCLLLTQSGTAIPGASTKKQSNLKHLQLGDCKLLTNASVRSISSLCPALEGLNLSGCSGISDIESLSPLFKIEVEQAATSAPHANPSVFDGIFGPMPMPFKKPSTSSMSMESKPNALFGMFAPPTPKPSLPSGGDVSPVVRLPPGPTSPASGVKSLQSLFAPPGSSPTLGMQAPHTAKSTSEELSGPDLPSFEMPNRKGPILSKASVEGSQTPKGPIAPGVSFPMARRSNHSAKRFLSRSGGVLTSLDIRRTPVPPGMLIQTLQRALKDVNSQFDEPKEFYHAAIVLESLRLEGSSWTDGWLQKLGLLVAWKKIQDISFECENTNKLPTLGSVLSSNMTPWGSLTDHGLEQFVALPSTKNFTNLKSINFSGQTTLTGAGISKIMGKTNKLEELICRRIPSLMAPSESSSARAPPLAAVLHSMIARRTPLEQRGYNETSTCALRLIDLRECCLDPLIADELRSVVCTKANHTTANITLLV